MHFISLHQLITTVLRKRKLQHFSSQTRCFFFFRFSTPLCSNSSISWCLLYYQRSANRLIHFRGMYASLVRANNIHKCNLPQQLAINVTYSMLALHRLHLRSDFVTTNLVSLKGKTCELTILYNSENDLVSRLRETTNVS